MYSDASNKGFAVVFSSQWVYGQWPPLWEEYHITLKEIYPLALAMQLYGSMLGNHKIRFMTDNEAVSICVRKQTSKHPLLMRLIRWLVSSAIKYNVAFSARHIPGFSNVITDHLSRLNIPQAQAIAPWLNVRPDVIPDCHLPWPHL